MVLSKWTIFFVGLAIILSIFLVPRILWLQRSVRTNAVVLAISNTISTRTKQTYPIFKYYANNNRIISYGSYNLPFKGGDTVAIRYDPKDVYEMKVDDFKGRWIDKVFWLTPILFVWILIFSPKNFDFVISFKGGKFTVKFG